MKLNKTWRSGYTAALLALVISGGALAMSEKGLSRSSAGASAFTSGPQVVVTLIGEVERADKRLSVEEGAVLQRGEIIHWRVLSMNKGDKAAKAYAAEAQIPNGTELVAGSPRSDGGAAILYSIDHGIQFFPRPMIEKRDANGAALMVPAPLSMYTDLRYKWPGELAPGATLEATYEVRVK